MRDFLLGLPKTDLHCHLDGSMRPETILALAARDGVALGTDDITELKRRLVCGEKVRDLPQFLQAFDITCAVLQTPHAAERIAYELAEDAHLEGVRYIEVRYSPYLMTQRGMSYDDAIRAVHRGLARAQADFGVRSGQIICALRVLDPKLSVDLALAAVRGRAYGVVGYDLAHAEKGNPPWIHAEAFRIAAEGGLGLTVHAGEAAGPDSILDAINSCKARRLGHGLTLHEDRGLEARVKAEGIAVECCPSSNVQISLIPSFDRHPLKGYLERGLLATLNTDNRLLTGIGVTDEYLRAHEHLGLTRAELVTVAENGFRAAFLDEATKAVLVGQVRAYATRQA